MKQITLKTSCGHAIDVSACPSKLLAIWGIYGLALAALWQLAGGNPWAQAAIWLVALAGGTCLLVCTGEI